MQATQNPHTELNPIQVSLLRLFNRPMTEEETLELKALLLSYYSRGLNKELAKVVGDRNYTQKDFDEMLNDQS